MTDQEKIDTLTHALVNIMQSADGYIDDGSWLEDLTNDIARARQVIGTLYPDLWNFEKDES